MKTIQAPVIQDHLGLLLLGAIWGSSFICISIALNDYPPTSVAALRILLAALCLFSIIRLKQLALPRNYKDWLIILVVGALNSSIPFTLISFGQLSVSSGTTAMLISTAPFAALLIAHFFTHDEQIARHKVIGLLLGFSGVLVIVGRDALALRGDAVSGQLMILIAAVCYGSSSILIRKLSHLNTLVCTAAVLFATTLYFFPLVAWLDRPWHIQPSTRSLVALIYLGLVPTALAYLIRFWLIQRVGSVYVSQVSYVIPLFALVWAWMFLSEVPAATTWLALGLILLGVMVNSWQSTKSLLGIIRLSRGK